jgi:hypothetical protein
LVDILSVFDFCPFNGRQAGGVMQDKTEQEGVWTEELLKQRRRRAAIMAVALLGFVALFFLVTLVKLGANVANRGI